MKINLGCGEEYKEGYINVDRQAETKPDVVHDLNQFPYPFADSSADRIDADHVLEHLDSPFRVMAELHRVLKPGGSLHIRVPHFSRGFTHAEHTHGFDVTFPLYFNDKFTRSGYFGVNFELEAIRLRWFAFPHLLKYLGYGRVILGLALTANAVFSFLADLGPALASRVWCFWVGGFDEIQFVLKCQK